MFRMRTVTVIILLHLYLIFNARAFFINTRDIRKFFGFNPLRANKLLKKETESEESSKEFEEIYHNQRDYPQNINEKLHKYSRERPIEHLDIEDSNNHESYTKSKSKHGKINHEENRILKVRVVNEGDFDRNKYSKVLLVVPDSREKYGAEDQFSKYLQGYQGSFDEDFNDDSSFYY